MEMLLILFVFLIMISSLLLRNYCVLSVSFLSSAVFLLASIAYLYGSSVWETKLTFNTIGLIIGSLIFLCLGEFTYHCIHKIKIIKTQLININAVVIRIEFILGMIVAFIYYKHIGIAALLSSSSSGNMIWDARIYMLEGNRVVNPAINIAKTIVIFFATFCIFVFTNNVFFCKYNGIKSKNAIVLLPLIPATILIILDTGRTEFIRTATMFLISFLISYETNKREKNISFFKVIKVSVIALVVLLAIFWGVGVFTNKATETTFSQNIAKYLGSGIGGLNEVIPTVEPFKLKFTELNTFRGINNLMSKFDYSITPSNGVLGFIRLNKGPLTNIYTALYEYYLDFGYIGTFLIYWLMGYSFSWLYRKAMNNPSGVWGLLTVFFYYAVVRQITAAEFLTTYFGITHIIAIATLFFSYRHLVSNKELNKRKIRIYIGHDRRR